MIRCSLLSHTNQQQENNKSPSIITIKHKTPRGMLARLAPGSTNSNSLLQYPLKSSGDAAGFRFCHHAGNHHDILSATLSFSTFIASIRYQMNQSDTCCTNQIIAIK